VDKVIDTRDLIGDEVDTPESKNVCQRLLSAAVTSGYSLPGIAIAGREAHIACRQVVLVDDTTELATLMGSIAEGLVIVAHNSLGDQGREVVGIAPADTLYRNGDVGSRDRVVADPDIRSDEVGLLLGEKIGTGLDCLGRQLGEVLISHLDQLLVGNAAGADEDHPVGRIVVLDVVRKLGSGDVSNVLSRA
jgi:hypothetical protein